MKYTPEQLEMDAALISDYGMPYGSYKDEVAAVYRAYAATLRQQGEQAGGVVSDDAVRVAATAFSDVYEASFSMDTGAWNDNTSVAMRAALEAVAPLLRAPAERARVPDGCKHDGKIIFGSKGKSADRVGAEIGWCSKCGQIRWGGDADPNANDPRFEDWCNQHLVAFGCAKETRGEKACTSWCGHYETCAAVPSQPEDAEPANVCTRNCDCVGPCKMGVE